MHNNFLIPREICIGGNDKNKILIGGNNPVTIQTMWKESIVDVVSNKEHLDSILKRINSLSLLGCDIIRFAVPDMASAESLCLIAKNTEIPLVADIHFDYKLALKCIEGNVSKIRINPGNIGSIEKTKLVLKAAHDKGTAIRIGVNSGSLPLDLQESVNLGKLSRAQALVQTAFRETDILDKMNFYNAVVSMKASTVKETIEANEEFAQKSDIPLHIGVTEAGPLISGIVKSTLAFSKLINEGIGSTIRVSLSSTPENEIITARQILEECGKRKSCVKIVSCPRCGREGFDVHNFVDRWQNELLSLNKNITVAVMGCVVNGPGEGKHADIGITGVGNSVIIFKHGKIVRKIDAKDADNAFREELLSL